MPKGENNMTAADRAEIRLRTRHMLNGQHFTHKGQEYTLVYGGATVTVIKPAGAGNHKEITIKR